jgi:uncharacterized protein YjbI with pentapeptide repeats
VSTNFSTRRHATADPDPIQRDDGGEARLWHIRTALIVSFTVAVVGLAGLSGLAWVLLGLAGYRHHGAPALHDTVTVLQLVFASVAGAGALVALVVAYRRQKVAEADSVHDRTRVFNERFTAIAAQLGDAQPAVRLAGVHAMAGLADDWKQNRQTCVDVLCAYLRLPYDRDPGDDAALAERSAYRANREVRHTIIRLISAHLRLGAAVSWQGLNFDFTGVIFDGGDFTGAQFSGGLVCFDDAEFSGRKLSFARAQFSGGLVSFTRAQFSGGELSFARAQFSDGQVSFIRAQFSGGEIDFDHALFSGSEISFGGAEFSGGRVSFEAYFSGGEIGFDHAQFSDGLVRFEGAEFSGSEINFLGAVFSGGLVSFNRAQFSGGDIRFDRALFSSGSEAKFNGVSFGGGHVDLKHALFSGGRVTFVNPELWSHPPVFGWDGEPPPGVVLPARQGLLAPGGNRKGMLIGT